MSDKEQAKKTEDNHYDERRRRKEEKKKANSKEKSKEVIKSVPIESETHKTIINQEEKDIKLLLLKLENPVVQLKEININNEIPNIIPEEYKFKDIPILELEKLKVEPKEMEINKDLPLIEIEEKEIDEILPLVNLDKPLQIMNVFSNFGDRIFPIRISPIPQSPKIPIYRKLSRNRIASFKSKFDDRIDNQVLQMLIDFPKLKKKEKIQELPNEHPKSEAPEEPEPDEGLGDNEDVPDFIREIFNISSDSLSVSKGPKIILYKELNGDSTVGSFETVCERIYREEEGGKPNYKQLGAKDDFNIHEISKWIKPEDNIIRINSDEFKDIFKKWFDEKKLNFKDTISRYTIGKLGFLIFLTKDTEFYEEFKSSLEKMKYEYEHNLDIHYIKPNKLPYDITKKMSSLVWGNVNLNEFDNEQHLPRGFDDYFNKLSKGKYEEYFKELNGTPFSNATKPHKGKESAEHKQLKWFVVKYLTKKLIKEGNLECRNENDPLANEINKRIITEEDTKPILDGKIADVFDTFNNEFYEIETFFGQDKEGKTISEKINYTIDKYKNSLEKINKINIIIENITLLRHLNTLENVKRNRSLEEKKKVCFYALDIQNELLISLKDLKKKLLSLW